MLSTRTRKRSPFVFWKNKTVRRLFSWEKNIAFRKALAVLFLKFLFLWIYYFMNGSKQLCLDKESNARIEECSDCNLFKIPSTVVSSEVRLNSVQHSQLFGEKPKNWTEKLVRFNSVCALLNERRWALIVAEHVGGTFELITASENYDINVSSNDRRNIFRPTVAVFQNKIYANKQKYIVGGHKSYVYLRQSENTPWRISNISLKDCKHFSGATFIGRFWCHIPHFMEDILAMLSVAYQAKADKSKQALEFHFILPEISIESCIMSRNSYFRCIIHIIKILFDEWRLPRVHLLFKEDVEEKFLFAPRKHPTTTTNRLICFDQILYNVRNVPRLGHNVLWVYNTDVISMLRKTTYNLIPFAWRMKYQQKFSVTLLQRKRTRRIINIESLANAITDFFGVKTRIVYFENTSFWYQVCFYIAVERHSNKCCRSW